MNDSKLKFGKCLDFLLSSLDISINQLSKAINVDSSLVNRWVNEKRIPPYNTTYIQRISEYLSKKINNSFQIQYLNELYAAVFEDLGINISERDKLEKVLLEAQGYSIEFRRMAARENKTHLTRKKRIPEATNGCQPDLQHEECIHQSKNLLECMNPINYIDLSSGDKIIIGSKDIFSAILSLLKTASDRSPGNDNTICISFVYGLNLKNQNQYDLVCYRETLLAAIKRGWNILYLVKLNNDINQAIRFISFALTLIKTGKFNPYYFVRNDTLSTEGEILAIPEIGAVVGLPTKTNSEIDYAFFLKNPDASDIIRKYFYALLESIGEPLAGITHLIILLNMRTF
jgi:transcriptional regulator with XRE-family HTH domain